MLKRIRALGLIVLCYCVWGGSLQAKDNIYVNSFLVVDFPPIYSWPANFRSVKDWLQSNQEQNFNFSKQGLEALNISASGQFSPYQLDIMLSRFEGEVYIVDLRKESHGFVSGVPVSWYGLQNRLNVGLPPADVHFLESQLLAEVQENQYFLGYKILNKQAGITKVVTSKLYPVANVLSEQELISQAGIYYKRFYVVDHSSPKPQEVDHFLEFIRSLPKDAWVHFHCRAGRGRSSTFMIMYDIIKNAHQLSLKDIVARQVAVGSKDILQVSTKADDLWKLPRLQTRKQFIKDFYRYVRSFNGRWPSISWSEWLAKQSSILGATNA